ncbi:MAG: DoxX family protein [Sphingorhabdus sp.]|uniref:DoxX family protein n=1 Tax=Sphingorhabdus sp. TaxID=1902408 RepID=UPI003CBA0186
MTGRKGTARTGLRFLLGIIYLIAGVAHVRSPGGFLQITPDWVPYPEGVVLFTGLCEIAGALALLFVPRLRYATGIAFAAYAVCVFPANINHAINDIAIGGTDLSWWYHGPRLAFQPVFVWWALWVGGVTEWPFQTRERA